MAKITANNSITVAAGSTLTFCEGGIGQAILDGNIYTLGMSDVFLGPFASAETIQVLVTSGPINYYTTSAPAAGANMTPVFVDPLTGYTTPASGAVFVPPTQDYLGIMIAHSAAVAAGGGTVALSGYYDLTQGGTNTTPLPVVSNVTFEGTGYTMDYQGGSPDNAGGKLLGGTILDCKGVMTAFEGNTNALTNAEADALYGVAPTTATQNFANAGITNFHAKNFGIKDPIYGIRTGALNRCGLLYSTIENVLVQDARKWGTWNENYMHCEFHQLIVLAALEGQQMWAANCGRYVAPGNSYANKLFGIAPFSDPGKMSRGIVVMSYNATTHGLDMGHVQVNRFNRAKITQTATFNGTASIGVTNLAEFPVNMPVAFAGCSTYGFADNQLYFVKSRSAETGAGTIIVADVQGEFETGKTSNYSNPSATVPADKVATDSGSVASGIYCSGFPGFEFIGLDTSGVPCDATMIDAEGEGTCCIYMQRGTQPRIRSANVTYSTNHAAEICLRNTTYGVFTARFGARYDCDAASTGGTMLSGFREGKGPRGLPGLYYRSDIGKAVMNLAVNYSTTVIGGPGGQTLENRAPGGGDFTYPGVPMGTKCAGQTNAAGLTIGTAYAGAIAYSGTGTTWSLVEITSAEWVGLTVHLQHCGASGNFIVSTSNGQLFGNQAGKTSYTLTPGQFLSAVAQVKPGGGYMWQVLSTNGT